MNTTTPRPTPETDSQCYDCEYRGHMGSVFTAEAGKSHPYGDHVSADFARKLERERDEMREELQQWKMLCAWGGTPEHIDQFIKGQQSRIHQAQDIEETCEQLERERDEAREQIASCAINTNVRLFDLVRYMRASLHEDGLITDEEYFWLCGDCEMANSPEGGSPSPRRLEDYDVLSEKLKAMREAIKEVSLQLTFAEKVSGASVLHIYVYDALAKLQPFIP